MQEERRHAAARSRSGAASATVEAERKRADRAESRCRQLVGALREAERKIVDAHQGLGAPRAAESETVAAAQRLGRHYSEVLWESERAREAEAGRADAAQRQRARRVLRDQLALPGMAACLVASCSQLA